MINNLYQGFLSCVFITIPEYMFIIIVTLRLMKRKELLDKYNIRNNLIAILKIVVPPAILLNILEYMIHTNSGFNKIFSFIILNVFLIILLSAKKHSYIEYPKLKRKAFEYFTKTVLLAIAIETVTYPIILNLINRSYEEIKLNLYLVILCSLAPRIIDIMILGYIFIKKNSKLQINMGDYIFHNKFFFRMTTFATVFLVILEASFVKLIIYDNLLSIAKNVYGQMAMVITISFLVPAVLVSIIYSSINYCAITLNSEKQNIRND